MLGAISTVAAIALANAVVRPPATKDDGWKLYIAPPSLFAEDKTSTDQLILIGGTHISSTITTEYSVSTHARNMIESLKAELASYGALQAGWDGDMSEPANPMHITAAGHILNLLPAGIPLPTPMLSADGEVGLYWKTSEYLADAVIEDAGHFSLFIRSLKNGNPEIFIPTIAIDATSSDTIVTAFQTV